MNTFKRIKFPLAGIIYAVNSIDHEETLIMTKAGKIGTCDHDAVDSSCLKHDTDERSIVYHSKFSSSNDWAFYY